MEINPNKDRPTPSGLFTQKRQKNMAQEQENRLTELEFYKFLHSNEIEWHRYKSEGKHDEIFIFVPTWCVDAFSELLFKQSDFKEDGINCTLKGNFFCFEVWDILEWYEIEVNNIFPPHKMDSEYV